MPCEVYVSPVHNGYLSKLDNWSTLTVCDFGQGSQICHRVGLAIKNIKFAPPFAPLPKGGEIFSSLKKIITNINRFGGYEIDISIHSKIIQVFPFGHPV